MPTVPTTDLTGAAAVSIDPAQPDASSGTTPVTPAATDSREKDFSARFAQLARREKALRAREAAIKAQEANLPTQFQTKQSELEKQFNQKLAQDPWGTMIAAGLTPEQATQVILNQPSGENVELKRVLQEVQALKSTQEQILTRSKEVETESQERQKLRTQREIERLIASKPDDYEGITKMGAQEAVSLLIEQTLAEDGLQMTVDEAANEIEAYCQEQALGFAQMKKVQAKLAPPKPAETPPPAQKQATPQGKQPATLTRGMSQSSAKPLTAQERIRRATLRAQGIDPDTQPGGLNNA